MTYATTTNRQSEVFGPSEKIGKPLTEREHQALVLYARLGRRRDVADAMGLRRSTIRHLLEDAYLKLDVPTSIDAFRTLGWLKPPEDECPQGNTESGKAERPSDET